MSSRLFTPIVALMLSLGGAGAAAQVRAAPPPLVGDGPAWAELSPAQRNALAPLQQEWPRIDAQRRAKWLELAARYPTLPSDEQRRMQGRMGEWARLSPSERGRARITFQEAKELPVQERQARWEAYQALPPEQREALARRAAASAEHTTPAARPEPAADSAKRNIVGNPVYAAPAFRPVAPTIVQAGPGATTTLLTRQAKPPVHQQPGLPKVAATQGFVDNKTLLPRRGAQGAGTPAAQGAPAPVTKP